MIHPAELSSHLATLPFLGRLTCARDALVAGERTELLITYEVGAAGLADGAWLKLVFKFYSDWAPFQTSDSSGADYVSATYVPREPFPGESPGTVRSLDVRFDQKGHERPWQKAVIIDVVDGYLKAGDRIEIRLGDRRGGGPGTRVQTFVERAFRFRAFVDTTGASRFAPVPGDVVLAIRPGPAAKAFLLTPRLVRPGVPFAVTLRVEDQWGNLAPADTPPPDWLRLRRDGRTLLRLPLTWSGAAGAWSRGLLRLPEAGDYELVIDDPRVVARVTADPDAPTPRALFADLHIHSEDTVGVNTTRDNLEHARDAAGLDVAGYTANDFNVRADRWAEAIGICRELHAEQRFLCFPGTEWCGASTVGGDRNVVFLGEEVRFPLAADGRSLRVFDWNEDTPTDRDQNPGLPTAAHLHEAYRDLATGDRVLLIPHVGGRRAVFDWHDAGLERLVEVASSWGHFDWFYRDALARGLQVGASAAGDEHRGRPGGGAPGVGSFGVRGGVTGVLAEELTSAAVAGALRARHTWATTGGRAVALLSAAGRRQGDAFAHRGPLELSYQLLGDDWERVELRDERGVVLHERDLHAEAGLAADRFRLRWGGARIRDRYRWAEWRGVVTITGARVLEWTARGLEHPEETVVEVSPGVFQVRADTYGDADHIEIQVDDPAALRMEFNLEIGAFDKTGRRGASRPDPLTPGAAGVVTGADLWSHGAIRRELGGEGLFVAAERVAGGGLPARVEGAFVAPPENGAHGFRALYLFARERDDHKVWTSPLFVRFES